MPGFNGQGPMGQGALTGWGQGRCRPGASSTAADGTTLDTPQGYGMPMRMGNGGGFGMRGGRGRCRSGAGMGMGRGMGMGGRRFAGMAGAPPAPSHMGAVDGVDSLKVKANALKQSLADVEKRIADMDKSTE